MALTLCLAFGSVQAADTGPRAHAEGKYDAATSTYVVVEGDDLFAIGQRFKVSVDALKAANNLTSDVVKTGEKLKIASGDAHAGAHSSSHKVSAKTTCEEFLGLDESFQPEAVSWAVAYDAEGDPVAESVDVEGIETVIPFVIEECKKAPKETFWQKVKAEMKKL
ncbi:HdeA/HdeB family chaperone [Thiocapsa imhoffii]|uniref:HdeA/HdeB family chaperone n=1 Tax=Thiocapsa imhoffii TaxID=382777 RepID=UPI001908EC40